MRFGTRAYPQCPVHRGSGERPLAWTSPWRTSFDAMVADRFRKAPE
jgi:hypothetical protein